MKLMTKELTKKMPKLYETENVETKDQMLMVKFFHAFGGMTWYATEYDADKQLFFGYVANGSCSEWGYFSLKQLEEVSVRGLGIERDRYFDPIKFSQLEL